MVFDPARDRVIFLIQRGCGQSNPYGKLEANTTDHMIQDITAIADYFWFAEICIARHILGDHAWRWPMHDHPDRWRHFLLAYSRHRKRN